MSMRKRWLGFTMVELLISISIFTVIIIIVSSLFITSFRLNQEVSVREQLYSDARFLLERLAREIRGGTIDYEEYFNRTVMGGDYGANYGLYRRQFYHPGSGGVSGTEYGSLCNNGAVWTPGVRCLIQKESRDEPTGQNPYSGHPVFASTTDPPDTIIEEANAFCGYVNPTSGIADTTAAGACVPSDASPDYEQSELYLISPDGREKTMFIREALTDPIVAAVGGTTLYAISMVKMEGEDTNSDAFPDEFLCTAEFDCGSDNIPLETDGDFNTTETNGLTDFVPISPNRLNVVDISFRIAPLESPFYAFAESSADIQHLPFVTILLTVEPAPQIGISVSEFRMTLQETVSTELLRAPPAPIPGQFG